MFAYCIELILSANVCKLKKVFSYKIQMALILYKWLMMVFLQWAPMQPDVHPFYVSVTEVHQHTPNGNLEITCKIFTDDFEHTLRNANPGVRIDLLRKDMQDEMQPLIASYIKQHLKLYVNGSPVYIQMIGYEQEEEGIISYFESTPVKSVQQLKVWSNLLYEYKEEQMNLFHITVNGKRKSFKLNHPEQQMEVSF